MRFRPFVACLAALFFSFSLAGSASGDQRPSIVVVLCDDLGYGDLQCYGHPHVKTPNLNALAEGGLRLTSCYSAAPVCSPSRVGLLTGRSPNRAGVYDWIPEAGGKPKPDARDQVHMRASEITIAQVLRDAGYQTAMAGKWHCNSRFNKPDQPQPGDFGFDHWMATQNNASPSHRHPKNFVRNGKAVGPTGQFSCQVVVDEAIDWLETTQSEKPFFLYLPLHETHEPVASPQNLVDFYRAVADSEDQAQYFANIANVDLAVGKLVDAITKMGRRDNTLVIFSSDNGPETLNRYRSANRSFGTPGPLRGMKLHTTEAGFRVAGIMNWPARIAAGQVSDQAVSSLDFLPTFCQLAGADKPSVTLDGASFFPVIDGDPIQRDKPLLWAYYNAVNQSRVAMRDGNYKVLAKLAGGRMPKMQNVTPETLPTVRDAELTDVEVYDVTTDIGETNDLAKSDPKLASMMKQRISAAYRELVAGSHVWKP